MSNIDGKELWRQIPPEEKIELLSRAHSVGVMAAVVAILIAGTIAVGLHLKWVLWSTLIASPLIFQFAAGRAWRSVRPRIMLEYLAVRSAARRFAFGAKSKDLTLRLIFRGTIEEVFEEDQSQEALEAAIAKTQEAAVWVALFEDAVVMLGEHPGGAVAHFARVINDKLSVEVINGANGDYSAGKEIVLGYAHRMLGERKVKLTSPYPAAMVVFEKALNERLAKAREYAAQLALNPPPQESESLDEAAY